MRVDAHQHFWRYDASEYSWISDTMEALKRDFLPDDLKIPLRRTGITGTIAVQARQSLAETDWLLELAEQDTTIKGVVGWIDLQSVEAKEQLQRYRHRTKLRGIRHAVQGEQDDRFMLRPDFLRGLGLLSGLDLTYDLLLLPKHLPVAVEVVKQFPAQRFVVDHLAKPSIKAQSFSPWQDDIRALARFENVYCKISGMVTEAAWHHWSIGDFTYYLDVVFDCFGSDRLMFGSDWPVCTLAASYSEVVLCVQHYVRGMALETQERIFGGNAARFYGLAVD